MKRLERKALGVRDDGVRFRQPFVDLGGVSGLVLDPDALLEEQDPIRLSAVGADAELVFETILSYLQKRILQSQLMPATSMENAVYSCPTRIPSWSYWNPRTSSAANLG